jgi:hypothetical protein
MKFFCTLSSILFTACLNAQTVKTYDIFSYKEPLGFQLQKNQGYLVYQTNEGKNYCQLFLYPAVKGQKDAEKDFIKTWDYFARNPSQKVSNPETKEKDTVNGWQSILGAARGSFNKQMFAITVSTFTKEDITYAITAVFTDKKYIPVAQEFISSVNPDEKKFVRTENKTPAVNTKTGNTQQTINNSITFFKTNFDDGWTSIITKDYVQVTKNGTEVRLYYVDAKMDRQRTTNTNSFESYYWDAIVKPSFNTGQTFVREKEQYSYGKEDIWEAAVTNKQTRKAGYLGMRLVFNSAGCRPIVVIAPDKNSYYSMFGSDDDFTKMFSYNKFAVAQNDLIGKWKSFEAASMDYYSIYSGDYAGMATASTNDEFVFNNNGTYQSEHAGTITFNGSLSHGKSAYKGTFGVNQWNLTVSNRGPNDPGEFSCQFEAVKAGVVLRLTNKKFTGMQMGLFKTN